MIEEALTGMMKFFIAKFMFNDMLHAAGVYGGEECMAFRHAKTLTPDASKSVQAFIQAVTMPPVMTGKYEVSNFEAYKWGSAQIVLLSIQGNWNLSTLVTSPGWREQVKSWPLLDFNKFSFSWLNVGSEYANRFLNSFILVYSDLSNRDQFVSSIPPVIKSNHITYLPVGESEQAALDSILKEFSLDIYYSGSTTPITNLLERYPNAPIPVKLAGYSAFTGYNTDIYLVHLVGSWRKEMFYPLSKFRDKMVFWTLAPEDVEVIPVSVSDKDLFMVVLWTISGPSFEETERLFPEVLEDYGQEQ